MARVAAVDSGAVCADAAAMALDGPKFKMIVGTLSGLILVLGGVGLLALCIWAVRGGGGPLAAGIGVLGVLCFSWGGDMVYRAATGAVPADRFFAGVVGFFRAVIGLVACVALVGVAVLIVVLDLRGEAPHVDDADRAAVLALVGLAAPVALVCGRTLVRRGR